ncbi:hypothetical protein V6N12_027412 [Hibiscus sabdariffa]|uniref:Uncharacterized protein n=1 Tax=Hibiscus sabdariffa TaxID=183260 RepID=A0ABR2DUS0_9ROSI
MQPTVQLCMSKLTTWEISTEIRITLIRIPITQVSANIRIFHGTTKAELMQAVRIGSKTRMHHQVSKLICLGILSPKAMPQYPVAIQWKLQCNSLSLQPRPCYKNILHQLSIMGICYKLKEHYFKATVHHYEP